MAAKMRFAVGLGAAVLLGQALCLTAVPAAEGPPPEDIPALILRIEGRPHSNSPRGFAKVRKRNGIELVAGDREQVFPGDRIVTDESSVVHLALNDGTLLRLGPSSDLRIEHSRLEPKKKTVSWRFLLGGGALRMLAERHSGGEKSVEIATPSVLARVDAADLYLEHDAASGHSRLFVLAGQAELGAQGCAQKNSCVALGKGQLSEGGQGAASAPSSFTGKLLLGAAEIKWEEYQKGKAPPELARRLALIVGPASEPDKEKFLDGAREEMAAAQDRLIGRTRNDREAEQAARSAGAYDGTLVLAETYAFLKGAYDPRVNGAVEACLAQIRAEQFRLGQAVRKAVETLGPKFEPALGAIEVPAELGGAAAGKKDALTRDYHAPDEVKSLRRAVADALEQFVRVLAFAGANRPAEKAGGGEAMVCEELACAQAALVSELAAMEEGLAAAYAPAKGERKQALNPQSTRFFSRTSPGCYKMVQDCRRKVVAGCPPGKKCKPTAGSPRVCSMRQMFVPCE